MTRDISSANQTASTASTIAPVFFVKLEFDAADVNLHTRLGPITWGGDTYTGAGDIGGISAIDEDTELSRSNLQLTLRGLPTDLIAIIANEYYQGRTATIYLGYLNLTTNVLVDDPLVIYRGRMDTASTEQGETLTVTVTVESRFAAWDRPRARRYNDADQQSRYPGDTGMQFIEATVGTQLVWGQKYAG